MKSRKIKILFLWRWQSKTDLKKFKFRFYRDPRSKEIKVRFTHSEYEKLTNNVQMPIAKYVRFAALDKVITRRINPPKINPELLRQIAFIGNNLNQLTKIAHLNNKKNELDLMLLVSQLSDINDQLTQLKNEFSAKEAALNDC